MQRYVFTLLGLVAFASTSQGHSAKNCECTPQTSVLVAHASPTSYLMRISATNTCKHRITFKACSVDKSSCSSGPIAIGATRVFEVKTKSPDGTANYEWKCS